MYATLVPTAGEGEAEETANWEYGEDAKGLPFELGRVGIPLGAFADALFAVADNVRERVKETCEAEDRERSREVPNDRPTTGEDITPSRTTLP